MEKEKTTPEYTARYISEDSAETGIFDKNNHLVVNFGEYGVYESAIILNMLLSNDEVVVCTIATEYIAGKILSEMYKRGYKIESHVATLYDSVIHHTFVLFKSTKQLVNKPFVYGQPPVSGDSDNGN